MKARIAVVAPASIWLGSAAVSQQLPRCGDSHHRFYKCKGDLSTDLERPMAALSRKLERSISARQ